MSVWIFSAVCPYLALETCRQWRLSNKTVNLMKNGKLATVSIEQAQKNYCKVSGQHVIGLFWFQPVTYFYMHISIFWRIHMSCMMLIYTLLRSSMIQEFGRTLHLLDIHSSCLVMILSCFQAVKAGLLKILSKMGISLLSRYMFTDLLYNCSYKKRPIPGALILS